LAEGGGDVSWFGAHAGAEVENLATAISCGGVRWLRSGDGVGGLVAPRLGLAKAEKIQALITMLEERNSCRIGCLY
jgi:hypothetical protein